jgi:hypothetical protein
MMNWTEFEREWPLPNPDISPAFSLMRLQKAAKTAMTLARSMAEIRIDTSWIGVKSVISTETHSVSESEWMQIAVIC